MERKSLKSEFTEATEERQIRFSANIVLEMSEKGKSDRKIKEYLIKTGASEAVIREAFELAAYEGLVPERERAKGEAERLLSSEGGVSIKSARRIISRLVYSGFNDEILEEIAEQLQEKLDEKNF